MRLCLNPSFLLYPQYQLVSGAGNTGSPQVLQISQGQGGQRVAVPLKMLLQPQVDLHMCRQKRIFYTPDWCDGCFWLKKNGWKCSRFVLLNMFSHTDKLCLISRQHSVCGEGNQHIKCRPLDDHHHLSIPGNPHHQGPRWVCLCATSGDPV